MTTIATDGLTMAGDGLCTGNGIIHGLAVRKVFKLSDGRIVGMCGTPYAMPPFVKWLRNGGEMPKLPDCFEALVLNNQGQCITYDSTCVGVEQELPAVSGSGGPIALGAMLAGATPEEAVAIAVSRDTTSGGTITVESRA